MKISNIDKKYNLKYKKRFDYKTDIHGQSFKIYKSSKEQRCPCYNPETGYGSLHWHRDNPKAPECDDNCYLSSSIEIIKDKAFIFPADAVGDKNLREIILAAIGEVHSDNYVYVGKSDLNIFDMDKTTDYLVFKNKKWKLLNPDIYMVGDIHLAYIALLEFIGEVENE